MAEDAILAKDVEILLEALRDARSWLVRTQPLKGDWARRREYDRVWGVIDEALKPYDQEVKRG